MFYLKAEVCVVLRVSGLYFIYDSFVSRPVDFIDGFVGREFEGGTEMMNVLYVTPQTETKL